MNISYIKCVRCNKEWADELDDGLCTECILEVEIDLAIVDLWQAVTALTSADPKLLETRKTSIKNATQALLKIATD